MDPTDNTAAAPAEGLPTVTWARAAMSYLAVNLWALPLLVLAYTAVAVAYDAVWQPADGSALTRPWRAQLWVWLALLPAVVAHELLHALGWIACGVPSRHVRFGVHWKLLTPYAHCGTVVSARAYRVGGTAPGVVLGLLPALLDVVLGRDSLSLFGALFLGAAAGDGLLLWLLRRADPKAAVRDLPDRMGCLYTTQAVADVAAVPDPLPPAADPLPPVVEGPLKGPVCPGVLDISSIVGVVLVTVMLTVAVGRHQSTIVEGPSFLFVTVVVVGALAVSYPLSDVVRIPIASLRHLIFTPPAVFLRLHGDRAETSLRQRRREAPLRQRLREACTAAHEVQVTEELRLGAMVCRTARTYAIAAGGAGTLIGLVILLAKAEDPTQLGRGAAFALITLLYGVLAGFLVFLPMQTKLERLLGAMSLPLPPVGQDEGPAVGAAPVPALAPLPAMGRCAARSVFPALIALGLVGGLTAATTPLQPPWRFGVALVLEYLPWALLFIGLALRAGLLARLRRRSSPALQLLWRATSLAAVVLVPLAAARVDVHLPLDEVPHVTALPLRGVQVDGALDDWPASIPWQPIEHVTGAYGETDLDGTDLATSADLSPRFRVAWDLDEQLLYVAVEVRDDSLSAVGTDPQSTDACEVYLDGDRSGERPNRLRGLFAGARDLPALQYVLVPGPGVYRRRREDNPSLLQGNIGETRTQAAWRRAGDVTTYEWAVQPFDRYPDGPSELVAGKALGFDVVAVDYDGAGNAAWVCWGPPGPMKFVDAAMLGEVRLVDEPGRQ